MRGRQLSEWVGKTPDTPIPPRVKIRVFDIQEGKCAHCTIKIIHSPQYDHKLAIILGGENRESNIQLLCKPCHAGKTMVDVAQKSVEYRKKAKNLGIKLKKSKPMMGSRASGWKRGFDGQWRRR